MLELFSGSAIMAKTFKRRGWETFTVDINPCYEPDLCGDVLSLTISDVVEKFGYPDVVWNSAECTCFSKAAAYLYWKNGKPHTDKTLEAIRLHKHALDLTMGLAKRFYFVENPAGMLRLQKFMRILPRYTITYCQYGDSCRKETDIWTNHPRPRFKPPCKPGASCHHPDGVQSKSGSYSRSKIPEELCKHIVDICEEPGARHRVRIRQFAIES